MSSKKERVTKVIDGDTFRTASRKHSIRLANVDAPEKGRSGSVRATNALKGLIAGQEVRVDTVARDKYNRAVANVRVNGRSVNKEMNRRLGK